MISKAIAYLSSLRRKNQSKGVEAKAIRRIACTDYRLMYERTRGQWILIFQALIHLDHTDFAFEYFNEDEVGRTGLSITTIYGNGAIEFDGIPRTVKQYTTNNFDTPPSVVDIGDLV